MSSFILARTYADAVAVTPSDATPQAATSPFAGLLVVTAGSGLVFVTPSGATVTMTGTLPVGTELHIACKQVKATGTGCTVVGLVAMPYKGQM